MPTTLGVGIPREKPAMKPSAHPPLFQADAANTQGRTVMPAKPPSRGTTTVEVHTPSSRPANGAPPRAETPARFDTRTSVLPPARQLPGQNPGQGDSDLDAILPAPLPTISELHTPAIAPRPARRPLEDYRISAAPQLSAPNAQGLRNAKGRLFVDGHDGSLLHVGLDPESGQYRAKLPNELSASGPILLLDPDSKRWHPLEDLESMIFPLTASRLEDYRTRLDFTGREADADGLYHFEKRLYVVIDDHAYQVMHDLDASSPQVAVMRLVRAKDPVAVDDRNLYVATRPGKSEPILFNPQMGWTGLLVGGRGGMFSGQYGSLRRRLANQLDTALTQHLRGPRGRARKLFPSLDSEAINTFIHSLGDNVAVELTRLEAQYAALKQDLKSWSQQNTSSSANTSETWVKDVSRKLLSGWRRETGATLTLPRAGGALPELHADFEHIRTLDLESITWSSSADTFLGHFGGVEHLSILRSGLEKIPAAISEIHHLTSLDLHSNRIKLDEEGIGRLSTLNQLERLDLSHNLLGTPPDVHSLSRLKKLNLDSTGIDQWPAGLQTLTGLEIVDLRNNRLREVPQAYLDPPAEQLETIARINNITWLNHNPFPADYWQDFDNYWQRLHRDRPDLLDGARPGVFDCANPRVARYRHMFPDTTVEQARPLIWALGARVEPELARLEHEFQTLQRQLDAWSFSGGGSRQGYVRANLIQVGQSALGNRYEARRRILQCWRRQTPQKLAFDGTPIGLELDLSGLTLPSLPDLDIDFSHVGSLKLNSMNLSISPEGFLSRFRHVRWLDLSSNQLRELPPAIGEMQGMTRLHLHDNRIILTPDTARILSERVTLRLLILTRNPLGLAPDFSRITDMRTLILSDTDIATWPTGLAEQPLLTQIDLSHNRITTIPDSIIAPPDARLAQTARINNLTNVSENPLSDATMAQVRLYDERLRAIPAGRPNRLVSTAQQRANRPLPRNRANPSFERWSQGLSQAQLTAKRDQWQTLSEHPRAKPFFDILGRLQEDRAGHSDQQRRIWEVLDTISENNPESERLRAELFDRAGQPACCDRAAFSFGNLEILSMAYRARAQALDQSQGQQLAVFSRRLLRLHEVDKVASADIQNSEAIVRNPNTSAEDRRWHNQRLQEEVEIRLAYRFGLSARLELPGQPHTTHFTWMGNVDQQRLDRAYEKIKALDNSPEEREALLSREFWKDYLTNKYRQQFEEQRTPFQDRLATLHKSFVTHQLTEAGYKSKSDDLKAQLDIEEAALMQTLTRQELDEPVTAGKRPDEAHTNPSN